MLKQEKMLSVNGVNGNMVAKLTIDNFSCIKHMEIDFRRLTVFIGEQASGKSVTCKLFYFFTQAFRNVFANSLVERLPFDGFSKKLEKEFHLIFPDSAWQNDCFRIIWQVNDMTIVVSHSRSAKKVRIASDSYKALYDQTFNDLGKKYNNKVEHGLFEDEIDMRMWPRRFISKTMASLNLPAIDYIPAGRSFFSTIQENVFALLSDSIGIDYFLKEFGRKIETRRFRYWQYEPENSLQEFESILHGAYQYDGKEQWIIRDSNHKVRLADASSGQQEVFPLLLILSNLLHGEISRPRRVVIEEPEAHLFPTAQMAIVELLQRLMHKAPSLGFVITTHSPFILCCLNNLIAKSKSISSAVSAYHLYDGISDSLYNAELRLINAERFDNISTDIANGGFVL